MGNKFNLSDKYKVYKSLRISVCFWGPWAVYEDPGGWQEEFHPSFVQIRRNLCPRLPPKGPRPPSEAQDQEGEESSENGEDPLRQVQMLLGGLIHTVDFEVKFTVYISVILYR